MTRLWSHLTRPIPRTLVNDFSHALLIASIIIIMVSRIAIINGDDIDSCNALLSEGGWLDTPGLSSSNWQPNGCMLFNYTDREIKACLKDQRVVFMGDSTTRQIFQSVARKLNHGRADEFNFERRHEDISIQSHQVWVDFIWDPWLNSTQLQEEVGAYKLQKYAAAPQKTALLVLGAPGLWYARYGRQSWFEDYKNAIDNFLARENISASLTLGTTSLEKLSSISNLVLLPIQRPWFPALSPLRAESITPDRIDLMEMYLRNSTLEAYAHAGSYRGVSIPWTFNLMLKDASEAYNDSGLHLVDSVADRQADILLNSHCNAGAAKIGYPYNRTCCSKYPVPIPSQWILLGLSFIGFPLVAFRGRISLLRKSRGRTAMILTAANMMSTAVFWCFISDRTSLLEKSNKQFHQNQFLWILLICILIGFASIRRNTERSSLPESEFKVIHDSGFLSRDQAEEWKGWMQCFVLLYHYTGASQILWIYKLVRILVASYLFMTGYGHTLYFLRSSNFSIKRATTVLVRLNLLSFILPYMMRTDYMFYYFAPLVTFWFLVVYLTLGIGHQGNPNITFLLLKVAMSSVLTTALVKTPGMLESIFMLLKFLTGISWSVAEWRFRASLDLYIIYMGMLCAIAYNQFQKLIAQDLAKTSTKASISFIWRRRLLAATAILLLLKFFVIISFIKDKYSYNAVHPYISFCPILCFLLIRNTSFRLRNYHSAAFAWLGRISLETYVLQYHIWLAGDSYGLLSLGAYGRGLDAAILTPLFLWMSCHVTGATQTLTAAIVDGASLLIGQAVKGRARRAPSIDIKQVQEKRESPSSMSLSAASQTEA